MLGARWSYHELDWGGYWMWDPVENASLMPWLTATAFLHSVMIQERRGMLRTWNVSLVLATGVLSILGTFLVRSGVLNSIHAFGASTLGVPFLLADRDDDRAARSTWSRAAPESLRSENRLDSLLSREAVFLLNNFVLVALCFVVFWGTFFPLIAEAFTGRQRNIGPPRLRAVRRPAGADPGAAERDRAGDRVAARDRREPAPQPRPPGAGRRRSWSCVLIAFGVTSSVTALMMFGVRRVRGRRRSCRSSGAACARGARSRASPCRSRWCRWSSRNRRRYGGYIVHVGIIVLFVGVAASSSFKDVPRRRAEPGQSARVGGKEFTYVKPTAELHAAPNGRLERISFGAELRVDGKAMHTSKDYFPSQDPELGPVSRFFDGESTTEVALDASLGKDIWAAVGPDIAKLRPRLEEGDKAVRQRRATTCRPRSPTSSSALALRGLTDGYADNPPPARFRLEVNPMVTWIWLGALIVMLGGLLAGWPRRRGLTKIASARYAARVGSDVREHVPA